MSIEVRTFHSMAELSSYRAELEEINRASRRRSPFTTCEYFEACLAADPIFKKGGQPWLVLAFEGARPIAYLALRRVPDRVAKLRAWKLEHMATRGVDRPHLVARPEDDARAAEAITRHLTKARGWSLLDLSLQDADSELRAPLHALGRVRHFVRELDDRQTTTVPIAWKSLAEYVAALSRKHRSHVKRMTLDTLATGAMSLARTSDPAALPALFDLYLAIEKRSWKGGGEASIAESPWRGSVMRSLLAPGQPITVAIEILVDGDRPVAGTITGEYEKCVYFLYTVFDDAYASVSPGAPMLLFAMERAIEGGFDGFNMLPDYAYYKKRWLGEVTDTKTIQVFRKPSALHAKARLGDLRRWLKEEGERRAALFNPERRKAAPKADPEADGEDGEKRGADAGSAARQPTDDDRAMVAKARALSSISWRSASELLAATPFAEAPRVKKK